MRGEVGESYWGGACDLLCKFGFGAFRDESTKKKIMVIGWELWGGWLLKLKYREERREIIAGRVRVMRGGWVQYNFWGESLGWVLRHEGEHREERRDEMRVQRRGDKIKKKADQWVHRQSKKLIKRVQFYYAIAIRNVCSLFKITSGHIPKHIVQTLVFQHQFPNNTILNWQNKHIFLPFGH